MTVSQPDPGRLGNLDAAIKLGLTEDEYRLSLIHI